MDPHQKYIIKSSSPYDETYSSGEYLVSSSSLPRSHNSFPSNENNSYSSPSQRTQPAHHHHHPNTAAHHHHVPEPTLEANNIQSNEQQNQKVSKSRRHGHHVGNSCNPCMGHFISKRGKSGDNENANVDMDAYDLASPCCHPNCVPVKRRSRHHKEHHHKHKHKDKERPPRPRSQSHALAPQMQSAHTQCDNTKHVSNFIKPLEESSIKTQIIRISGWLISATSARSSTAIVVYTRATQTTIVTRWQVTCHTRRRWVLTLCGSPRVTKSSRDRILCTINRLVSNTRLATSIPVKFSQFKIQSRPPTLTCSRNILRSLSRGTILLAKGAAVTRLDTSWIVRLSRKRPRLPEIINRSKITLRHFHGNQHPTADTLPMLKISSQHRRLTSKKPPSQRPRSSLQNQRRISSTTLNTISRTAAANASSNHPRNWLSLLHRLIVQLAMPALIKDTTRILRETIRIVALCPLKRKLHVCKFLREIFVALRCLMVRLIIH